jgi:hypothetical protein
MECVVSVLPPEALPVCGVTLMSVWVWEVDPVVTPVWVVEPLLFVAVPVPVPVVPPV